ncbi:efflux RND transporter periplasmic adaptor subunit [Vibrio sp. DW001]|uniref:efflux RND transporter periplasmic adaptor subunit n=1 Tax=Vibrio sp. DW001 TaxID=2912315 RepID=UPI0023B0F142|nr:efflux RND transporter periplasmic adaptor subunit [Vibrio sp. DW001]WED28975.1 efflux RND transporter periplasmic adaptor subunit [Vibrio sp. DW001]
MHYYSALKFRSIAIAITTFLSVVPVTQAQVLELPNKTTESIRPIKLINVGRQPSEVHKNFPAKVAANQQVNLAFRINGLLTHLDLLAGQQVTRGDVLAQLDNRDAKNALLDAEANHQLANVDFTRKKELLVRKLISKSEFDIAKAQLQSALATLRSAEDQLSYTSLIAPFSGVIAKVDLENHQMLQASQVVLTLQSSEKFDLTFNVPESYIFNMSSSNLRANQGQYRVKFNGVSDSLLATFKEMNTVVNSGSQTYKMTLSFTSPKGLSILPGMSAEVVVSTDDKTTGQPITILPLTAIVHDEQTQQDFVWVYQSQTKTLRKSTVVLGKIRTEGTEILAGLSQGDQVVAVGANAITSKTQVVPLRWERGV